MTECPSHETLQRFLQDDLPEDSTHELLEHLEGCDCCCAYLDSQSTDRWIEEQNNSLTESTEDAVVQFGEILREVTNREPPQVSYIFPDNQDIEATDVFVKQISRYEVISRIAVGGSGILYKAKDTRLGRLVAIKVLRAGLLKRSKSAARIEREARTIAWLSHDNIVRLHELVHEDGSPPCLVMEYVIGETIATKMNRVERLDIEEAVQVVIQIASALECAHDHNLVHRDVKPANILLDKVSGRAKLTDFGLARDRDLQDQLTIEGAIAGTPGYMSPEQITHPESLDARSDIYSLGVVLYEALTGSVPFPGDNTVAMYRTLNQTPRNPRKINPDIPVSLQNICLKAISKEPRLRYQTAAEFQADLKKFANGQPVDARPISARQRIWRWASRNKVAAGLIASMAFSLMLAVGLALPFWFEITRLRSQTDHANQLVEVTRKTEANIRALSRDLERQHLGAASLAITHLLMKNNYVTTSMVGLQQDLDELQTVLGTLDSHVCPNWIVVDADIRAGELLARMGKTDESVSRFKKALARIEQRDHFGQEDYHRNYRKAIIHASIGNLFRGKKQWKESLHHLQSAQSNCKRSNKCSEHAFGEYLDGMVAGLLGRLYLDQGRLKEAMRQFELQQSNLQSLAAHVHRPEIVYEQMIVANQIGRIAFQLRDYRKSIRNYKIAKDMCGTFIDAPATIGQIYNPDDTPYFAHDEKSMIGGSSLHDSKHDDDDGIFGAVFAKNKLRKPTCRPIELALDQTKVDSQFLQVCVRIAALESVLDNHVEALKHIEFCHRIASALREADDGSWNSIRSDLVSEIRDNASLFASIRTESQTSRNWQELLQLLNSTGITFSVTQVN